MRAAEPSCSFLLVVQRDCACARVSVYIDVTSSALRSLTRDWDLLMGRIWSGRSEPAPLHFCCLSGAFTHLSPNALLSRDLLILIHTRMCAACLTVSTLSRDWGDLINGYLAPCVSERIISKMWNCCWSRTPACKLGSSGSVRLGYVSPRVITFVGGVLGSPDH